MPGKGVREEASGTAMGTAFLRALACKEHPDDPVGADHMAETFLPLHMRLLLKIPQSRLYKIKRKIPKGLYEFLMARTVFFDGLFLDALKENTPQVVMIGAGYDTRPYRFAASNTGSRIFELDIITTQTRKRKRLHQGGIAIPPEVSFVPIDFQREPMEDVLKSAGYNPDKRTLFLFEGVSYYLLPEAMDAVLKVVSANVRPESLIAFDYRADIPLSEVEDCYGAMELALQMAKRHPNEKSNFSMEDAFLKEFLEQRGLIIRQRLDNEQMEEAFLAHPPGPPKGQVTGWFRFATASPV